MGSLRDIIEQNKRKALENGAKQSVLQSQPKQTETSLTPQNIRRETLSEKEIGASEQIRAEIDTNQSGTAISTAVVEPGPVKKSLFAKLGNKNANAANSQSSSVSNNLGSVAAQTQISKATQQAIHQQNAAQNTVSTGENLPKTNLVAETKPGSGDGVLNLDELRSNLTYLANNIEQKELVGQVIRKIAFILKQNPQLVPHLQDADVDLCVRGLRRAYTVKARQASEKRENKKKTDTVTNELAAAFRDAGLFK